MKKILTFLFGLTACTFILSSTVSAQTDTMVSSAQRFSLGPILQFGADVYAGDVPEGLKTDIRVSWNGGALLKYGFNDVVGASLLLAYDDRAVKFHNNADETRSEITDFHSFMIAPSITIKDLFVGFGFGLPLGAYVTNTINAPSVDLASDKLNTIIEFRLGGEIPIIQNSSGALNFEITATYQLTKMYSDAEVAILAPNYFDGIPSGGKGNGPLGTLRAGFSYLFSLGN